MNIDQKTELKAELKTRMKPDDTLRVAIPGSLRSGKQFMTDRNQQHSNTLMNLLIIVFASTCWNG